MKPPKIVRVKMVMPLPSSKAVKTGRAVASMIGALAHHPPSEPRAMPRMERPHGGKGPHN